MKQFILVLFLSVLSVCTFAQDRITINDKNITRIEAFQAIEKQTGYSIAYEQSGLDLKKKLNLLLREVTLNEAIKAILYGTNLTYKINGYHII